MCPIRIEFFPDAEKKGLILLHGDEPQAVARLRAQVASLAANQVKRVAIHEIPGFVPIEGCRLFFSVSHSDCGTYQLSPGNEFECELDPVGWENVFGMLEPFTRPKDRDGFQWVDSSYWGISIIISTFRGW
jgi:hypothetical protein